MLGHWRGANKRAASGYKNFKVLGVAGCGTTSERPRRGYSKRATLGGCTAELKSSAAWGSSTQLRPAVQKGVVLADRVLGVAPWGFSFRREPLHANSHAGRLGTTFRGVVGALSCTDMTAYPAGQKKKSEIRPGAHLGLNFGAFRPCLWRFRFWIVCGDQNTCKKASLKYFADFSSIRLKW